MIRKTEMKLEHSQSPIDIAMEKNYRLWWI